MSNLVTEEHLESVIKHIDENIEESINKLKTFLNIPSISTDPKYKDDVHRCAEWITQELKNIGLDAKCHKTNGHPMVTAIDDTAGSDAPRILYYGHYDVQPPEPLCEWETDPFNATVKDSPHGGKIVARGAADGPRPPGEESARPESGAGPLVKR